MKKPGWYDEEESLAANVWMLIKFAALIFAVFASVRVISQWLGIA